MGQQETKQKKWIQFKPGIRKDFFKAIIFMLIFMGVMLGAMPIFGMYNGMAFGMAVMGVLMTLSNDMTLEPVKNGLILIGANVGMTMMAFVGYGLFPEHTVGRIVLMTVATLLTFFLAIFLFTSEERNSMYMPLLLSFSLLIFYNSNTTGTTSSSSFARTDNIWIELLVRMAIYAGAGLLGIGLNFLVHGRKFRKKIRAGLDGAIQNLEQFCDAVYEQKGNTEEWMQQSVIVDKTLSGIEGAMGTKMSIKSNWQAGHDMIRTITILKRMNHSVTKIYVQGGQHMDAEVHTLLHELLEVIDQFENDKLSQKELEQKFDALYHQIHADADHEAILESVRSEMEDFIEGEVQHVDKGEEKGTVGAWIRSHFSIYSLVFALKYSVLAALSILLVEIFQLPMGYMMPLYIGLTAQPYLELSKGSVKKRISNTIYAAVLILISFSISIPAFNTIGNTLLHFGILIVITLVADMFFQFDFMTMMGTMFAVIMNIITRPDQLYSYTFWRVGYILAACLLVQIIDLLIFPRRIPETIAKQIKDSLAVNQKLRVALANENCGSQQMHEILMEKRQADQCLRTTNRYAKNDAVTAYLLADEEWINRMTMIGYRLKENGTTTGELRRFVANEEQTLTLRQKNILTGLDEALMDIVAAEKMAMEMNQKPEAVSA